MVLLLVKQPHGEPVVRQPQPAHVSKPGVKTTLIPPSKPKQEVLVTALLAKARCRPSSPGWSKERVHCTARKVEGCPIPSLVIPTNRVRGEV